MKQLTLAAGALVLATALLPQIATAQNIAIVNNKPVPKSRIEPLINQVVRQGQPRTPELERQVRDEIVFREILTQEAERVGVQRGDDFRQQMELARQSILIRELFTQYQKNNPVTDAEIQSQYDKLKGQAGGKEYHARHILVESEDEAKKLIAQIKGGSKFEDLAKKFSKDPGSGQNGGDLDWAGASNYVPEFSDAMVKLEKGKLTDEPVKSQFGWHIIRLDDVRDVQFPPLEQVAPRLRQEMEQQKLAKYRDDLRTKAKTDYKFGG